MANEPPMDQSVMISLDNIMSDDGDLGGMAGDDGPKAPKGVNLAALGQVGVTQGSEYRGPINAPVVQRLEINEPKRSGVLTYLLLTVTGVALVGGGIFLGNRFMLPAVTEVAPDARLTPPPTPPAAEGAAAVSAQAATAQAPQEAAPAPAQPEAAAEAAAEAAEPTKTSAKRSSSKGAVKPKAAVAAKPEAKPEPAPEPPPEVKPEPKPEPKRSEAASLLSALKSPKKPSGDSPAAPAAPAAGGLKERLDRDDILSTVRKNQGAVNQCKPMIKTPGTRVEVRLVIDPSGAVSSVTFLSPDEYKGTPLEGCLKERVGRFSFPKFGGSPMSIKLPFNL